MIIDIKFIFVFDQNKILKNNVVVKKNNDNDAFKRKQSIFFKRITFDVENRIRIDKLVVRFRFISKRSSFFRNIFKIRNRIFFSFEHFEIQIENQNDNDDDFIDIDDDDDDVIFDNDSSSIRQSRSKIQQSTTIQNQNLNDLNEYKNNFRRQLKIEKDIRKMKEKLKILKKFKFSVQRTLISFSHSSKFYFFVVLFEFDLTNLYLFVFFVFESQILYLDSNF